MSNPQVTVIIPVHSEPESWPRRALTSVRKQIEAPDTEIILIADRPTPEVKEYAPRLAEQFNARLLHADNGDLGLTRNQAIAEANGEHIAILDADDIFGCQWLRQAYQHSRKFDHTSWMLHTQYMLMFGAQKFVHRCFAENDPEFDARDMVQYNAWSALAYAPRELFSRYPYEADTNGRSFEDWHVNVLTLGAGVRHECVPGSVHFIRMKHDETSLAYRVTQKRGTLSRRTLFDRRDLPAASHVPDTQQPIPEVVYRQTLFAHHEVGERQIMIDGSEQLRMYPRQKIWNDQAWLRDQIGDTKNVVLVNELLKGGAEKYALEYCEALGGMDGDVVLIETAPGASPWLEEAKKHVRVVQWRKAGELNPDETAFAAQRAIIQCELDTLSVFNSKLGWMLVHANSQALAKKVIAASFATIPLPGGFTSCPPFFLKGDHPTLTLLTDNERHAAKMRDYLDLRPDQFVVIPPRVSYSGDSKRSTLTKKHLRVLWAGRGSDEKCPQAIPYIAMALRDEMDIHVFGDVQAVPHALDNLKYRGPFDGFESIDGAFDCYLMTSINEGFPNTALEAALADLPVVAPDVGDLKKIACVTYQANLHPEKQAANAVAALRGFRDNCDDFDVAKPRALAQQFAAEFEASIQKLVAQ